MYEEKVANRKYEYFNVDTEKDTQKNKNDILEHETFVDDGIMLIATNETIDTENS